jgi:RAD50-interacting protein 1
MLTLG